MRNSVRSETSYRTTENYFQISTPSKKNNSENLTVVYRYNFNGKESDSETSTYDYGFRIYNSRLGRFLSVDPLTKSYPELTPYQYASNTPIQAIDLDGLEASKYVACGATTAAKAQAILAQRKAADIKRSQEAAARTALDNEKFVADQQAQKVEAERQAEVNANNPGNNGTLMGSMNNDQVRKATVTTTTNTLAEEPVDPLDVVSAVGDAVAVGDALNNVPKVPNLITPPGTSYLGPAGNVIDVVTTGGQIASDLETYGEIQPETVKDAAITVFELGVVDNVAKAWPVGTACAVAYYVGKAVITDPGPDQLPAVADPGAAPRDNTNVPACGPPGVNDLPVAPLPYQWMNPK